MGAYVISGVLVTITGTYNCEGVGGSVGGGVSGGGSVCDGLLPNFRFILPKPLLHALVDDIATMRIAKTIHPFMMQPTE